MGEFEEEIATSEGSDGFRSRQAHHVGISPQEDRCCSTCEVEEAEGSSGCPETQAPHFSSRQKENCGGCTRTMGSV
jgi:hypothetical protein